jgi:hypothetical protein
MAFHYEVIIDQPMAELFRRKFLLNASKTKASEMFKLLSPGMPNLWEFKTGKDIFTLSFSEESGEQKERLAVDSMTLDLKDVVLNTIQDGLVDYTVNFLLPLSKLPKVELENKIKDCFKNLGSTI